MTKTFIQLIILIIILFKAEISGQDFFEKRTGEVTYKTSRNIYIKFESTDGIRTGDTLFLQMDNSPCVIVIYLSSRSCAGKPITDRDFTAGEKVFAFIMQKKDSSREIIRETDLSNIKTDADNSPELKRTKERFKENDKPDLTGRFSVQSYSSLANRSNLTDFQRWRYSLSLKAAEIAGSDFSFSSYLIFTYKADDWKNVKSNIGRGMKVYDFGLSYKIDETSVLWFGRHINRRLANVGSIDGIQYEKAFGNYYSGLITGARPNFSDLGFNLKLFEYGAYIGRSDTINSRLMENTLSFFQQTNNSKTDRRFIYIQHTNSLIKNVNFYASSEIDLYKRSRGTPEDKLTLTSLFISGRFTPDKIFSVSLSYDARKNVIYYETFKSFADSIFENETRQGLRGGISIKPLINLFINFDAGYRFRKRDPGPSKNISARISYSNIPIIGITPSFSYSGLTSSYMDGNTWGITVSKSIFNLSSSLNYKHTDYLFINQASKLKQNSVSANLGILIIKKLYLNLSYESTFENKYTFSRILTDLSFHF